MSEKTLLASAALFRELYDNNTDIYDVIAEFIKAGVAFTKTWSINTTTATQILKAEFGLQIPEAVVSATIKNRLAKKNIFTYKDGQYITTQDSLKDAQDRINDLKSLKETQNNLLQNLIDDIKSTQTSLQAIDREKVTKSFCDYIFEPDTHNQYSKEISSFIIKHQNQPNFTDQLNAVKEGFVLYDGVRHTPNLNEIEAWKTKLTVYLDTEYLFNSAGYNGALYKQLFDEFHALASEIRSSKEQLISLRYFTECEEEIDRFFHVAEEIIEGKSTLDPSKPAMVAIVNRCSTKSDIQQKKAKFRTHLDNLRIKKDPLSITEINKIYNIGGSSLLEQIKIDLQNPSKDFNDEKCLAMLQMFSKINAQRKGKNNAPFESIGSILVSESNLSRHLAFHAGIFDGGGKIPYATDLDFITNRLWFKLRKGLAPNLAHPQSLNVLAKAQVVLASQIKNSISNEFNRSYNDYSSGKLKSEEIKYLLNQLRSANKLPEEITQNSIDKNLAYLSNTDYEYYLREQSALIEKVKKGEEAKAELEARKKKDLDKKYNYANTLSIIALLIFSIFILVSLFLFARHLLEIFTSAQDTTLSIISLFTTIAFGILPFIKIKSTKNLAKTLHSKFREYLLKSPIFNEL